MTDLVDKLLEQTESTEDMPTELEDPFQHVEDYTDLYTFDYDFSSHRFEEIFALISKTYSEQFKKDEKQKVVAFKIIANFLSF